LPELYTEENAKQWFRDDYLKYLFISSLGAQPHQPISESASRMWHGKTVLKAKKVRLMDREDNSYTDYGDRLWDVWAYCELALILKNPKK